MVAAVLESCPNPARWGNRRYCIRTWPAREIPPAEQGRAQAGGQQRAKDFLLSALGRLGHRPPGSIAQHLRGRRSDRRGDHRDPQAWHPGPWATHRAASETAGCTPTEGRCLRCRGRRMGHLPLPVVQARKPAGGPLRVRRDPERLARVARAVGAKDCLVGLEKAVGDPASKHSLSPCRTIFIGKRSSGSRAGQACIGGEADCDHGGRCRRYDRGITTRRDGPDGGRRHAFSTGSARSSDRN